MNSSDRIQAYEDLLGQFEVGTIEHLLMPSNNSK